LRGTRGGPILLRMPINFLATIPILRSYDEGKAREFYVDWLGFTVDWEHRFEPWAPLYMQVAGRASCSTSPSIMATARRARMCG
jgi:hypothetical protein